MGQICEMSEQLVQHSVLNKEPIYFITQFFVHPNKQRHREIQKCLRENVNNSQIDIIYLLNERIYTPTELGISSNKINQITVGHRLQFKDVFDFVDVNNLHGYIVFANSDIYFNNTLENIKRTDLHREKEFVGQLRFDYNTKEQNYKIFGPRFDSQDTWLFHSNFNMEKQYRKAFGFMFGQPGCDNKILYMMKILGYKIYNEPRCIHTIHLHETQIRNYTREDSIPAPWLNLAPYGYKPIDVDGWPGTIWQNMTNNFTQYNFSDNAKLFDYIAKKLNNNQHFLIPRIAGVENQVAHIGKIMKEKSSLNASEKSFLDNRLRVMKSNAGVKMTNLQSVIKYSNIYLDSFNKCDMYGIWEPWGDVYRGIRDSHNFITYVYNKDKLWAFTFDIFHYIFNTPWTHALKGKRLLIISPFIESFKEKVPIREKIYGVDLFPDCEFVFIKPPQTQGSNPSAEFDVELNKFMREIENIKDSFDIALCSCGGYGNLVCSGIYDMGKSAIYVGGVLQMYFGVLGQRWLRERSDIVRLYLNEYWSRPKEHEKPRDYKKVEGSCYW